MADVAASVLARLKNFENRGRKFTVEQFKQVMTFGSDDAMQKTTQTFFSDSYTAAVTDNKYMNYWSANNGSWTQGGDNNG